MEIDLLRLLGEASDLEAQTASERFTGTTLGIVTEIGDVAHLGRVKVRFPYIAGGCQTGWARIAAPWAGQRRGSYFIPEVDDEVLVAFEHGDLRHPYILGCLWSETALPPEADPHLERRELRSKSGHALLFDDSKSSETLTVRSQGGQQVVLSDASGAMKVLISDRTETIRVLVDVTNKTIALSATGGRITLDADDIVIHGKTIKITGDAKVDVNGKAGVRINGAAIEIASGAS